MDVGQALPPHIDGEGAGMEGVASHDCPLPEWPFLQVQVFAPGPVMVHVALGSHPPLFVAHGLTGAQVPPSPAYPELQAQVAVFAPLGVHCAVGAHPPLFVAQAFTPMHVIPLPV
jgi:hypothetical protein